MKKRKLVLISVENHNPLTWEHDKAFLEKLRDAVRVAIREKVSDCNREKKS